jgi:type II secretory pathway pseudopilin PulG
LVELLVALMISGVLLALVLQLLVGDLRQVGRLGRWLREQQTGQRTLDLIRSELQQAEHVSFSGEPPAGCGSQNRRVVLQLSGRTAGGATAMVTYTYGASPASIWRGSVLMRCGPAYGLDGSWSDGEAVVRVLIDALPAEEGFVAVGSASGILRLQLRRQLADGQMLRQEQLSLGGTP